MPQKLNFIQPLRLASPWKKSLFLVLLCCFLMFACRSMSKNTVMADFAKLLKSVSNIRELNSLVNQADLSSIDAIVKAIYQTISFPKGEDPNWDRFRALFVPNAKLIRITQDGVNKMDIEGFILSFTERIRKGLIRSFREAEISQKTDTFGDIAQIFSTYVKNVNPDDSESSVRGINSIQLYYDGQRWWISSLLWEDERVDNIIPQKYLR